MELCPQCGLSTFGYPPHSLEHPAHSPGCDDNIAEAHVHRRCSACGAEWVEEAVSYLRL